VRLRQVVPITDDLPSVTSAVERELGLSDPFVDPGVGEFGLENRVYAAGDCFLEVLTPVAADSAGRRFLDRRGEDGGYMAIFQFDDRKSPRQRAADLGIRIVWRADFEDISGTHLHPSDVGAAIISLDWADPPESWRWAGPSWRGGAPANTHGGITSLTVAALEPDKVAAKWADVLGDGARLDGTTVHLEQAHQELQFDEAVDPRSEGIVDCGLALPDAAPAADVEIGGVHFSVTRA